MRPRSRRVLAGFLIAIGVACGARTGLDVGPLDAGTDATVRRPRDGGPLDVQVDCGQPSYCQENDPGYIYQCGVRVYECGSLESCRAEKDGARCVNPCDESLGNDTSNGCDFYALNIDTTPQAAGACYAVWVVNQWDSGEPAKLRVTRGNSELPIEQFARIPVGKGRSMRYDPYNSKTGLEKDQVAILFLARDPAAASDVDPIAPRRLAGCPDGITPAVVGDPAVHGTGRGVAFRLTANVPVVAYQMLPFGAGRARVTSATLLLPTNLWGDNYVAVNAYAKPTNFAEERLGSTLAIIAKEDNTVVRMRPRVDVVAGNDVGGGLAGATLTYTLQSGQYLQFTQETELTGSAIQTSRPVGVIGGSTLMNVPVDMRRADTAHQMIPPIRALGSEYVAVRYRSRLGTEESVPWRIVGVVAGTSLSYSPKPIGAPTSIGAGEVAEFWSTGPFVVRTQDANHPIYVAGYMTGGQNLDGEGDAEFVNVLASSHYRSRFTFFTDPTYPETNLVIVRARDEDTGQLPNVKLDCFGTITSWQTIDGAKFEFARIDLSRDNFEPQGQCDNGVHTIDSTLPNAPGRSAKIGVTVWGWGSPRTYLPRDNEADPRFTRWVSYAYPAGIRLSPTSQAVLPAQ